MNKNTIVLVILAVLVLVSAVQAVQLVSLKTKIGTEGISAKSVKVTGSSPQAGASSESPSLPANIQNLPGMVGGC